MKKKVFVLRADYGTYTNAFKQYGYIGIGWFGYNPEGIIDITDRESIRKIYKKDYSDEAEMTVNQNVGQIYRFLNDIKIGDIVITPFNNNELLIGSVTSDFYFEKDDTSRYCWRKKVEWRKEHLDRHEFSVPLQNTLKSSLTCFSVSSFEEVFMAIGLLDGGKKSTDTTMIVTTTISSIELIRKKFLELGHTEFELLVAHILKSLGFEATQDTGRVGDGGIDFEGVLDVMGVASINLQVQVKRYDKGLIGEKDIRNFRGALKKDYQGCFVTLSKFNKKASESANDKERESINLIDGEQLIEIFIEKYDKVIDSMYNDDLDDLADKLKFKKSLLPI
ncbi:restriction endonuclease [Peijinzhouia sedimentorum]